MAGTFTAQIDAWVNKTERRKTAVFRESAMRVLTIAQTPVSMGGKMPVDTGFLRSSLQVEINKMPEVSSASRNFAMMAFEMSAKIGQANYGDAIFAVWGARYAIYVEYGTTKMAPRAFVRSAAAQWPRIVNEVTQELVRRSGG